MSENLLNVKLRIPQFMNTYKYNASFIKYYIV